MATIKQWEDSLATMGDRDIEKIDEALEVLSQWKLFTEEYNITHLSLILSYVSGLRDDNNIL